ncbi:DNA polymerase nu-like [Trichoplusia ni]|uniref:DNA polymerase nu-like n=1 Tax=Trichoplusia ni TaxID=7111 RepID=A0A7E5X344_TRINI|nr:DNA polymerase nu-like [Trichoplusia ni]
MFDSKFLQENNGNVGVGILNDINEPFNVINNKNEVVTNAVGKSVAIKSCTKKRKNKKLIDHKPKKIRNKTKMMETETSTMDNNLQEKVSCEKPKNMLRKQCYTRTVKNWLDDVESLNSVAECVIDADITNNSGEKVTGETNEQIKNVYLHDNKHENKKVDVTSLVSQKTQKTAKKVVQAQLANKDGVMKFSKPKINKKNNLDVTEKKQDNVKGKTARKFVPPIKSQIPVKNVTYEVFTVNEMNIETYDASFNVKDNEVLAVLLYSNGYCQLNSHHTDGACIPDGLIICCDSMFYCFKGTGQKIKELITRVMENNKIVCFGARDILIYMACMLQMETHSIQIYDVKIGGSLLDPDNSPENFSEVEKLLSFTPQYTIGTECVLQKAAWYLTLLGECWQKLCGMLKEDALWNVFVDIEAKLLPIITDMELRGVMIDLNKLKSMEEVLENRMKLVEQQCYKAAGKVFQINSALQVRSIIYDELKLDTKCNVKIRETLVKGAKSTNESMLRSLISEHPLPKLILEYRHLHKAHATFLSGISQHIKDGVVKPTWVQNAAATGRIASNSPNLQAIPKAPFSLVMFPDAADGTGLEEHLKFRSVYISREGHSFLAADFKHIECRVFAHAAADKELQHALASSDDLFRVLSAKWLKKSESEVSAEERERTKRLVYASLYGAGAGKLREILGVSHDQAPDVAASFHRTFPSLKSFAWGVSARLRGGLAPRSLCGRTRRLPPPALRQAVNLVVQGSAADVCKTAMIATAARLRASAPPLRAQLVLQIHDELVWEVRDQHLHRAAGLIKQVMEDCGRRCGMGVSLPVSISVGKNWGDMLEYNCVLDTQ